MVKTGACFILLMVLAGCSGFGEAGLESEQLTQLASKPYPAQVALGEDLDILVIVDGAQMQLVNRTPRTYDKVELWLNQQYVGLVERINIGTDNQYNLHLFANRYQETYPTGSFLHPDRAFPVVQAEIHNPLTNTRHRLIARQAGL